MDIQWVLGGMVCGSQAAFLDTHVHVVKDQSYVVFYSLDADQSTKSMLGFC